MSEPQGLGGRTRTGLGGGVIRAIETTYRKWQSRGEGKGWGGFRTLAKTGRPNRRSGRLVQLCGRECISGARVGRRLAERRETSRAGATGVTLSFNSEVAAEVQTGPMAADVAAGGHRRQARGTAGDHRRARGAEFGRLSHYVRDPFPALSHWVGALLAAVAMGVLLLQGQLNTAGRLAVVIYGMSLVVLFASSAFSHTRHCSEAATLRLVKLDYAAIFLLIAGTYTPVMILGLGGTAGYAILAAEWVLAAVGAILVTRGWRGKKFPTAARIVIYVVMGWLGMIFPGRILAALGWANLIWLIGGGVIYTVGAVIFVTDRPRLWPGRFVAHDLWHLMVIAGAACHFVVVEALVRR